MRSFICMASLLIVIILSGCGDSKPRKSRRVPVKTKSISPTTTEDGAKKKEAGLIAEQKRTATLAEKKAQTAAKEKAEALHTKKLADQEAAKKAAYMKKKNAYLAKKADWNKQWQGKADAYEAQLVVLRNGVKQVQQQMMTQKAQISTQYKNLGKLKYAARKKTRYYYLVKGGKRTTNPTLHLGYPPKHKGYSVKYVFKYDQGAVSAYKAAQTRYASSKKSYVTLQHKLSVAKNKIVSLATERDKCLPKIKK